MSPVPEAVQVERSEAVHVQDAPVSADGTASCTVAPSASEGPPFATVIVYGAAVPGTACALPSSFKIDRFTCGVRRSSSVAESLPALGSVSPGPADSVAVLIMWLRAAG